MTGEEGMTGRRQAFELRYRGPVREILFALWLHTSGSWARVLVGGEVVDFGSVFVDEKVGQYVLLGATRHTQQAGGIGSVEASF